MAMSALGELIENQRAITRRSYEAVAAKARREGYQLGKSWVYDLATKPVEDMPTTSTLRALAVGLGIPLSVVVDAALESCGLRRPMAPSGRWVTITARKDALPELEQRRLERQVEGLFAGYESEPDN